MNTKINQDRTKISLREITRENFNECIKLKVAENQKTFVASNIYSIAESKVFPLEELFTIYANNKMVGFLLYGFDEQEERYYLGRLMIDEKEQGKGYGKAAMLEVIVRLKKIEDCDQLYISFVPDNVGAEKLYSKLGFKHTGNIVEGEIEMKYSLSK